MDVCNSFGKKFQKKKITVRKIIVDWITDDQKFN